MNTLTNFDIGDYDGASRLMLQSKWAYLGLRSWDKWGKR
jgi:hypothetical protein